MQNKAKFKGISRIDSGTTHGWFVRAYKSGKTYSKLFSDRKCGDGSKALEAARIFHAELLSKLESVLPSPRTEGEQLRYVRADRLKA